MLRNRRTHAPSGAQETEASRTGDDASPPRGAKDWIHRLAVPGGVAIAGLAVLIWAVSDVGTPGGTSLVAIVVLGVVLLTFGQSAASERVLADLGLERRPELAAIGAAALWTAALLLVLLADGLAGSGSRLAPIVGVCAVAVALAGLGPLAIVVDRVARTRWIAAIMAVAAAGTVGVVLGIGGRSPAWSIPLGVLALLSFRALLRERRDALAAKPLPAGVPSWVPVRASRSALWGVSAVGTLLVAVGLGILLWFVLGGRELSPWWVVTIVVIVLVALVMLGVSWKPGWIVGLLGAALIVLGVLFLYRSGLRPGSPLASATFAVLVALVGAFVVWRGKGVFPVVLAGFVVVWGMIDRTADEPPDPAPSADRYIVALGDSYISGEGAGEFFGGTDVVGTDQCRRAPTAYPYRLAVARQIGLAFLACSGAKTLDPGQAHDVHTQAASIAAVREARGDAELVAVLVSVGGNDVQFGSVAKGCLLPGSCTAWRDVWLQNVEALGDDLTATYEAIREQADGAPVIVVPYPMLLTSRSCDATPLVRDEHEFLVEFVTVLDEQLRVSAARAGVVFFEDAMFAFQRHDARICDDRPDEIDATMNLVALQPSGGRLWDRMNPANWTHNSMHPTASGHELLAELLDERWDELLGTDPRQPVQVSFEVAGIGGTQPELVDVAGDLPPLPCDVPGEGLEFATRLVVRADDADTGADGSPDPVSIATVQLLDADPEATGPVPSATEGCPTVEFGAPPVLLASGDAWIPHPEVTLADGVVTLRMAPVGDDDSATVLFLDRSGRWQLRVVGFCERIEGCPTDYGEWAGQQFELAVETAAPHVLVLVLGGWMIAVALPADRWLESRFRDRRRRTRSPGGPSGSGGDDDGLAAGEGATGPA